MDNHAEPLPVARRENFARLVVAGRSLPPFRSPARSV